MSNPRDWPPLLVQSDLCIEQWSQQIPHGCIMLFRIMLPSLNCRLGILAQVAAFPVQQPAGALTRGSATDGPPVSCCRASPYAAPISRRARPAFLPLSRRDAEALQSHHAIVRSPAHVEEPGPDLADACLWGFWMAQALSPAGHLPAKQCSGAMICRATSSVHCELEAQTGSDERSMSDQHSNPVLCGTHQHDALPAVQPHAWYC